MLSISPYPPLSPQVRIGFTLPPSCYATMCLRELTKQSTELGHQQALGAAADAAAAASAANAAASADAEPAAVPAVAPAAGAGAADAQGEASTAS